MNPIDAFKAAGLNPIVIDENFDFNSLNGLLLSEPPTREVLRTVIRELCDLLEGQPDDDVIATAVAFARGFAQ